MLSKAISSLEEIKEVLTFGWILRVTGLEFPQIVKNKKEETGWTNVAF